MRLAIPLILGFFACPVIAQEGDDPAPDAIAEYSADAVTEFSPEAERCIRVRSIRRTEVVDDQTIIFFMRNRDIYVNTMPRDCPQLVREDRFAYEARGGNLCDTDFITVLMQFGSRFEPGFTCRLGQFVPANQETVDMIIAAAQDGGATSPVSAEPVDLPEEDADEESQDDDEE